MLRSEGGLTVHLVNGYKLQRRDVLNVLVARSILRTYAAIEAGAWSTVDIKGETYFTSNPGKLPFLAANKVVDNKSLWLIVCSGRVWYASVCHLIDLVPTCRDDSH